MFIHSDGVPEYITRLNTPLEPFSAYGMASCWQYVALKEITISTPPPEVGFVPDEADPYRKKPVVFAESTLDTFIAGDDILSAQLLFTPLALKALHKSI